MTGYLNHFWWGWLPGLAGRATPVLAAMLTEGRYLLAVPGLAGALPTVAVALGLVAGVFRFGADAVFTQSALILVVALVFGFLSSLCGAAFAVGYVVADLVVHRPGGFFLRTLMDQAQLQAGLAITYVALVMLTVGLPVIVRMLRAQLPDFGEGHAEARVVADLAVSVAGAAAVTFFYVQALPMLVRPVWAWQGRSPALDAIVTVQQRAWAFALAAAVVAGARTLVEYGAAVLDPDAVGDEAPPADRRPPGGEFSVPAAVVRVLVGSALVTVLLSGLTMGLVDNLVLFGGLTVIGLLRAFGAAWVPAWPRTTARVPPALRLVGGLLVAYWLGGFILDGRMFGVSFLILIWALLAGFFVLALLFPPFEPEPEHEVQPGTGTGAPA